MKPLDSLVKVWAIVIAVGAVVASSAVAHYRLVKEEEATIELRSDQKFNLNLILELKSDIRVMREILERLDLKPKQ